MSRGRGLRDQSLLTLSGGGGKNEFERDHIAFKRNGGGLAGRQSIKGGL